MKRPVMQRAGFNEYTHNIGNIVSTESISSESGNNHQADSHPTILRNKMHAAHKWIDTIVGLLFIGAGVFCMFN